MTVETAPWPAVAEPTTPIRPSEALRLGRLIRPRQTFGPLWDGADGACAVGAMLAGGLDWSDWPASPSGCPEPKSDVCDWPVDMISVTIHLNDDHYWPTERIATWLESLGL